jgi:hypothetical protein
MDMKTLLTKLAQARIAESQATTDRLKIEQEIIELGGVYDGKLDVTVGIINRKKTKMSDRGDDYYLNLVLEKIKRAGRCGITKNRLTGVTRFIKADRRDGIIDLLIDSKKVSTGIMHGRTKTTTVYTYNPN